MFYSKHVLLIFAVNSLHTYMLSYYLISF